MGEKLFRSFVFDRAASTGNERDLVLSFSSEEPVMRAQGWEILDHSPGAVDLKRLQNKAPLLVNHDSEKLAGAIMDAWTEKKRGWARVRFSRSQYGEEIYQDVKDTVRLNVSVGYIVHETREAPEHKGQRAYRVTKWEPYEISMAAIPADATVGVGRAAAPEAHAEARSIQTKPKGDFEMSAALRAKFIDGKNVTITEKEPPSFNLAAFVRSRIGGAPSEAEDAECKRLAESSTRKVQYGQYVPFRALSTRDLDTFSASGAAGGLLVGSTIRPDQFIDYLRPYSIAAALGVSTLGGLTQDVSVPRFSAGSTGYWVAEGDPPTESTPTVGTAYLRPLRLAAFLDYTRNLLLQAVGLEEILRRDLAGAFGAGVDAALLNGSGSNSQPTGILSTTGVGSVSGATFSAAIAASIVGTVETANVPLSGPGVGWVMPPATAETLRARAANGTGSGFLIDGNGKMLSFPVYVSTSMPSATLVFGNFLGGVQLAQFGPAALDIIVNPYSGSKDGLVSIVANAWLDVFVRQPSAFCKAVSVS